MKKNSALHSAYAAIKFLIGMLTFLRLGMIGIEHYAPHQWSEMLAALALLPSSIQEFPLLLHKQEKLWGAWIWIWRNCWKVYLALLMLPQLGRLHKVVVFFRDLALEIERVCLRSLRRSVGWVVSMRCKRVNLMGCQFVIVHYRDGSEQVVNIREVRKWADWQHHSGSMVCLRCGDEGAVTLEWPSQYRRLEDRRSVAPGTALREKFPELEGVESITLYDDSGR